MQDSDTHQIVYESGQLTGFMSFGAGGAVKMSVRGRGTEHSVYLSLRWILIEAHSLTNTSCRDGDLTSAG